MNTVETIVITKDSNGNVTNTFTETKNLPTNVTGMDLEYEVYYNSSGDPIITPKRRPKF